MNLSCQQQHVLFAPESADFYKELVTQSLDVISVINEAGNYIYVSDSVHQQLGYEVEEMLGQPAVSYVHPEDKAAVAEALNYILQHPGIQMKPFQIKTRFGEWRWIQCSLTNMLQNRHVQGILINSRDITEAIAAETAKPVVDYTAQKAVQRELEKLSLVASKTINGIAIMDAQCRIEWVNDGFCRITGYSREEVVGLIPSQLLQGPESDPEVSRRIKEKYQLQEPFSEEIINYKKNGEKFWFSIDVTPIFDEQGQLVNYIAIETDITEKKENEVKLTKMADDLLKHNRNLQQFAYLVSHNLRAPVANALGLAALVTKLDKNSTTYDISLSKLQTSVQQLDGVIKDISSILSTREAGGVTNRKHVNLLEVCKEVVLSFQEQLQETLAEVNLKIDGSFEILSIKAYLYSILYNLISNALKFRALERQLALDIQIEKDKRGYVLTFSDNGLGMDMHLVEHQLFKLYNRFHPHIQGKGIGLFLVKTQVEALGGKIKVDSTPGVGTTFTIYLGAKHV